MFLTIWMERKVFDSRGNIENNGSAEKKGKENCLKDFVQSKLSKPWCEFILDINLSIFIKRLKKS